MEENRVRVYRFRESGTGRKWALDMFHFYPDIKPGDCGRGPYCVNTHFIKAADRKKAEKALAKAGAVEWSKVEGIEL